MAQKQSLSTRQAILAGLGITALVTGVVIAVSASKKKKLQGKISTNTKAIKSIKV
jgi:hypothetical protein